jgi:hypothetical protein
MGICHNSGVEKENKLANPTTNYGFVLPTPTDLVTDLPADFDVALQGVDTRLKALQPNTTLGDLAYGSATANTNTRLGIGTTGQLLTVAGGVPTWAAAPSSGGMTLLSTTSMSGATVTVSGISGSYVNLFVYVSGMTNATASGQFRIAANGTTNITNQFGKENSNTVNETVSTYWFPISTSSTGGNIPLRTNSNNAFGLFIHNYASTTAYKTFNADSTYVNSDASQSAGFSSGGITTNSAITSLVFSNSGGNMSTGTILIYGVK